MSTKYWTGIVAIGAALLLLTPQIGSAQAEQSYQGSGALEEIIVTARKREESLEEIPVAISVYNEYQLYESGIDDMRDLFDNTVGLVYNDIDGNRGTALPGVRGVKSFTSSLDTDQRISSFMDGMPVAGSQATIQMVDVVGVEVYRGPQSAVFGRSVFGGAINYSIRKPSHEESSGGVNVQVGQDSRRALSGFYTAPITEDSLAFAVSGSTDSYDGPGSVVSNDGFKMGSRATDYFSAALSFRPSNSLELRLRYSNTQVDDGPAADYNLNPASPELVDYYVPSPVPVQAPLYQGELQFEDEPALTRNFCYGDDPDETFSFYNCIEDPGWELDRNRLELQTTLDLEDGQSLTFRAFTSEDEVFYIDDQDNSDINTAGVYIIGMGTDIEIDEDYLEAIWTSPDEQRLRYTLGASRYNYDYEIIEYFGHPSANPDGIARGQSIGSQEVNNLGIFAGLFYDLSDRTTVSVEGRRQRDEISALDADTTDDVVPESDSTTFLPRIAVAHQFSDALNVYAQISKGVQPATINAEAAQPLQRATAAALEGLEVNGLTYSSATPFLDAVLTVEEETLWNYEIGLKSTSMGGRLTLAGALFLIETEGYAEQGNLFYTGEDADAVVDALNELGAETGDPLLQDLEATALRVQGAVNIADLSTLGLETEFSYLLSDQWEIQGGLTYLRSRFDEGCAPIGDSAFGIADDALTLPGGYLLPCTSIDDNAYPFTPEKQLSLATTYRNQLANGLEWFGRLDLRYEDRQYIDWFESGWIPASTRLNLRAGIDNEDFRAEIYVENLTDDRTPVGADYAPARNEVRAITGTGNPPFNTGLNVAIATPREAGVRFSYSF